MFYRIFKFVVLGYYILNENIFIFDKVNNMQLTAKMGLPYTNQLGEKQVIQSHLKSQQQYIP